jgi:hypothetical protein
MTTIINAATSGGLIQTADTSGVLQLQTASTAAVTIDASQNVGVGTTTARNLEVSRSDANTGYGSTAAQFPINIRNTNTTANNWSVIGFNQGTSSYANPAFIGAQYTDSSAAALVFGTSSTERMRINSAGYVTTPNQPAFRAGKSDTSSVANSGTIIFDSAAKNIGGCYSTSTGRFTAPVAGMYQFATQVLIAGLSNGDQCEMQIRVNGADNVAFGPRVKYQADYTGWSGYVSMIGTASVYLNANDYVEVQQICGATRSIYGSGSLVWTIFSGFLIG